MRNNQNEKERRPVINRSTPARFPRLMRGVAALCCLPLLLTACQQLPEGESSIPASSLPSASSQASSQAPQPKGLFNPLTGENNLPESAKDKRPVSIMVSNIKQALPQYGLSKADICYEVLAEGGITRIMAIFADYQSIPTVGPVRSVRDYYVDLAQPHSTIFCHFGGSPKGYQVIRSRGIDNIDGITLGAAYQQDKQLARSKGQEHSFFMTKNTLQKGLSKKGYSTSGAPKAAFSFAQSPDEISTGDQAASSVTVPYSSYCTATFSYQESSGKYLKSQFGQKHMDAGSGTQIAVTNLLVLKADCAPIAGDKSGRITVNLSSGSGYYFTGGKALPIHWKKGSAKNPFVFTDPSGTEIKVAPGKTWVSILDTDRSLSFS